MSGKTEAKLDTIPVRMRETRSGELFAVARRTSLQEAYSAVEAQQFSDPDDRDRLAEILALTRAQTQDDISADRPQRMGAGGSAVVLPHDPDSLESYAYERDSLGRQTGKRGRIVRPKTARELWEDQMLAAGFQPILESLTVAQQDAIRLVWREGMTRREAAAVLGIKHQAVNDRLTGAYAKIRAALVLQMENETPTYRDVRKHLRDAGVTAGAEAGRGDDLPPGSQRPSLTFAKAREIELGDSLITLLEQHGCKAMCKTAEHPSTSRRSFVEVIPVAFSSRRFSPALANSVAFGYRVPDREEDSDA
jgi:predicted DNA-binding protein (UPF0251 family)